MLRNELYKPWFSKDKDWGFEILDGMYKDVVIQIESLDFAPDKENMVELNYHVISKPELIEEDLTKDPVFVSQVELIINDILHEAVELHKNEQNRNDNT